MSEIQLTEDAFFVLLQGFAEEDGAPEKSHAWVKPEWLPVAADKLDVPDGRCYLTRMGDSDAFPTMWNGPCTDLTGYTHYMDITELVQS